jgi:hypothetical protein
MQPLHRNEWSHRNDQPADLRSPSAEPPRRHRRCGGRLALEPAASYVMAKDVCKGTKKDVCKGTKQQRLLLEKAG